jgi:hypothetical protein
MNYLPLPYICNGGPWHSQVLWLTIGQSTLPMRIVKWISTSTSLHGMDGYYEEHTGRYVKRYPEVRASVAGAKSSQPLLDWEPL